MEPNLASKLLHNPGWPQTHHPPTSYFYLLSAGITGMYLPGLLKYFLKCHVWSLMLVTHSYNPSYLGG
jgi:hypothetical protein